MPMLKSIALRLLPGAYIANSGYSKLNMPAEASAGMQQMAASGIPAVSKLPSDKFGHYVGIAELAVGGALLTPFVSDRLAGLGLTAFSAGLLTMYFGDEGNTEADGIRPSSQGTALAKDSFLLAIGLALLAPDGKKKVVKKVK